MLSSRRFFVSSLVVLALGVGLWLWRSQQVNASKLKTVEQYWAETGLGSAALEDLLGESTCGTSERYFLACTNAILNIAARYNLMLTQDGKLTALPEDMSIDMTSEKKQLESWRSFFSENTQKAQEISFLGAWRELEKRHIKSAQKAMMIGIGLNAFISVFRDPHTYFMPVAMFKEVVAKADNKSTSLGILLGRNSGKHVIRKVLEGSPAKEAGLKKGDIILSVNRQNVSGLLQARVGELLKGEVGSTTRLLVQRAQERKVVKLTRSEITVATVSSQIIKGIRPIAVISVNKFAKDSCELTKEALVAANDAQVRGLLLDLRDNPGGQMEEAACIAGLFVGSQKKIFEIRYLDPSKEAEEFFGSEDQLFTKPVAVLINSASASAAEIVAGSLRDLGRAVIVGERSFGKGSFQEGEFWAQNKKIALFETKGFYYLPSGQSPQMRGLEPDVVVKFDYLDAGRESDQFIHPLMAPERAGKTTKVVVSAEDCLDMEDSNFSGDDLQLSKARQVLFCAKAVAGAQQ